MLSVGGEGVIRGLRTHRLCLSKLLLALTGECLGRLCYSGPGLTARTPLLESKLRTERRQENV